MHFQTKSIVARAHIAWRDVGIEKSPPSYIQFHP